MSKKSLIPDTLERLIETKGCSDHAAERLALLKALWTEEITNDLVKDIIAPWAATLNAKGMELADETVRAVLKASRAAFEQATDPVPGVMDDDESTSNEGGAP